MKKIAIFFISIVLVCVFCVGVSADFLSAKDFQLVDEYGNYALVLLNNGNLLFGETEKREPGLVAENVSEVMLPANWPAEKAIVKYRDNSAAQLKYNLIKSEMLLEKPFAQNVASVVDIPKSETSFEYLYIDKDGVLSGKRFDEELTVMTDIKKAVYSKNYLYMLTTKGELYKLNCRSGIRNKDLLNDTFVKIGGAVKDFTVNNSDCAHITTMNELYVLKDKADKVEIIATDVADISKVVFDGDDCYYLTNSGVAYKYKLRVKDKDDVVFTIKLAEGISKLYIRNSTAYLVDENGKASIVSIGEKNVVSLIPYASNVSRFFDGIVDLLENTDGKITGVTRFNDEISVYDITGAVKVKSANKNQKWFVLKNNGELIMAEGGVRSLTKIKLAPICDRRTKLFMNGKEAHLQTPVQIVNGRSMYPLRECMEMLGAEILWDDVIKTAIAKLDGKRVEFPVGKMEYVANGQKIVVDDIAAYVDTSVNLTFVPIRYAAEALGFTVGWEQGITFNSIIISK